MAKLSASSTTTTDMNNTVDNFTVSSAMLDQTNEGSTDTTWEFNDAQKWLDYYKTIPELKKAIDALAKWTTGRGFVTDTKTKIILEGIRGWGEDSIQNIFWNMTIMKKVVGDAFAQIIRDKETGNLINLKPIFANRVKIVMNPNGTIKRYDIKNKEGTFKPLPTSEMFHLSNDRIADEIHGTSVLEACMWVIDARNEAMADERRIKHRDLAMGVLEIDTDDPTKRNQITQQYQKAVNNGDVLVLPKGLAELKDPNISPKDRLAWIRYLEGFFYKAVGIPEIILGGADTHTEAGGKVGYITFEPTYVQEQTQLESDVWNQLALRIKFNRPASLGGLVQEDEAKNTGQLNIQKNDVSATVTPE